jgi:metallophosphoesterase (TIGR00282 family)
MLGDVVGKAGRDTIRTMLPQLREMYAPDFIIVNGENSAAGKGITPDIVRCMLKSGVDVITLGNHAWGRQDIIDYVDREPRLLRPANYPPGTPGKGANVFNASNGVRVGVVNLMGRIFMDPMDDPFRLADTILESFRGRTVISFFDFHAEATSEKMAFGYYMDGRASVVVGTHTHVQTADERVLPGGTAYITDVGMVGPENSVIGMEPSIVVERFVTQMPCRFEVACGAVMLCGVVTDIDAATGRATHIERVQIRGIH